MWTRNMEVCKQSIMGNYDMFSEYQDANESVGWEDCANEFQFYWELYYRPFVLYSRKDMTAICPCSLFF